MKSLILSALTAVAVAALIPATAVAQDAVAPTWRDPSFYGTLGYGHTSVDHLDFSTVQLRLGARFTPHFGVEAEGAWGVSDDTLASMFHTVTLTGVHEQLTSQEAIYGVSYLPMTANLELLARIGYGHTAGTPPQTVYKTEHGALEDPFRDPGARGDSWNFGLGGQYTFDGKNGVRVDYLREVAHGGDTNDADVWSIAYLRRF